MRLASILVALLAAAPAVAQQQDVETSPGAAAGGDAVEGAIVTETPGASDDCTFLQQSFAGVYDGLRMMAGGDVEQADPATVTMFTAIQTNIILMAQGAGCDMGPMIEVAREQLARYAPEAQ